MPTPSRRRVPRCSARWGATVAAVAVLAGAEPPGGVSARSRERLAVGAAAALLGDTATVTRSSYIHPAWTDVGRSEPVVAAVAESSARVGTTAVASLFTDPGLQAAVLSGITKETSEVVPGVDSGHHPHSSAAGEGRVTGMLAEWDGLDAEPGGQRQRFEDRAQPG